MPSVETDKLLEGLKSYFANDDMVALISKFNNSGLLGKVTTAASIAMLAVQVVEKLADDAEMVASGGDKRQAIIDWLDDAVDVPFYLEPIDGMVIGIAIDAFVTLKNVTSGRDWIKKLTDIL